MSKHDDSRDGGRWVFTGFRKPEVGAGLYFGRTSDLEGGAMMGSIKATKVCGECGEEYRRFVDNHDERQDLCEGLTQGLCDECWELQMYDMQNGGGL